jgi:hypothetical protein
VANIVGQDTYIILSEQVEGAEHLIVLNIKGPCSLEVTLECEHRGRLDVELLGRAHLLSDLPVVLLSRHPGRPPRSAAVMVVRMSVEVLLLVLATVVEELRHGGAK